MNKKEFLDILYEQLSGQMPEGNVAAHVQYYRNYIEDHSSGYNGYENFDSGHGKVKQHSFHLDLTTWYGKLAVILIAAVVIILLCTVLSVLIPIMIVAGVILYVLRLRKR